MLLVVHLATLLVIAAIFLFVETYDVLNFDMIIGINISVKILGFVYLWNHSFSPTFNKMLLILWINCMKYIVWIFWVSFIFLRNLYHWIDNSFFQNFFDYFCFQKMLELANFIFVFHLLIPNFGKHIVVNLFCTSFEVFKFIIKIDFNFVKIHLHYFLKWWIWYLF